MIYTILGAGGAVGNALAHELSGKDIKLKFVSRSGHSFYGADAVKADITSLEDTVGAVKDSDVVFLVAGLKYDIGVWREAWPKIIDNVTEACKRSNARLIFLDNVYMYGLVKGKMTESTPYNPISKKGEVRAKLAVKLENEYRSGNIKALIARSADFYGPFSEKSSVPYILIIDKLLKGKKAQLLGTDDKSHSYTYTLDIAKSLILLAQTESSFNQIWHLPTHNPAPDGKTFVEMAADQLGRAPSYSVLKPWMVRAAGVFDRTVGELYEMMYQNTNEYHFDSGKFNSAFSFSPVTYRDGIRETIITAQKSL